MPGWIISLMRRGGLLALVAMLTIAMLGFHLHHHHPADEQTRLGHDHDHGHGHDHPAGDDHDDGGRDPLVLHLHAVDAMTLPEQPLLGTDASVVVLERHIPVIVRPDGPVIDVDPRPVRSAA